jgi:hypothetical protein
MLIRLVLVIPLLVTVFLLHVSGTALILIHIARITVIGLVMLFGSSFRARHAHPNGDKGGLARLRRRTGSPKAAPNISVDETLTSGLNESEGGVHHPAQDVLLVNNDKAG